MAKNRNGDQPGMFIKGVAGFTAAHSPTVTSLGGANPWFQIFVHPVLFKACEGDEKLPPKL